MIGKPRKYCAPRSVAYPLQLLDVAVDWYARGPYERRNRGVTDGGVPRFLLMSAGHLGDALTLSYLFPIIRQAHPGCDIDVVAGDWCDPILKGSPYIRRLIHLNHANTNRRDISWLAKWRDQIKTTRTAIAALKTETYTASVDIRFSDSPMHFLLPFIRVQRAVGFGSRGLGGLLDDEFFLPDDEFHHLTVILDVLKTIGVEADLRDVQPFFDFPPEARQTIGQKLPFLADARPMILLFPETGQPTRFMPDRFWQQLAGKLLAETDCLLVGCGTLPRTKQLMQQIRADYPDQSHRIHETVGKLTIPELAALAEQAVAAFTLDSLPSHLCSIFCPTVTFSKDGLGIQFFPLANYPALALHNHWQSRNLTIDRPGFESRYVETFDETVLDFAIEWLQTSVINEI